VILVVRSRSAASRTMRPVTEALRGSTLSFVMAGSSPVMTAEGVITFAAVEVRSLSPALVRRSSKSEGGCGPRRASLALGGLG